MGQPGAAGDATEEEDEVVLASRRATLRMVRDLLRSDPWRSALLVLALVLSGVAEGLGIATVLPLLQLVMGQAEAGEGWIAGAVVGALRGVGLDPNLETMLAVVVVLFVSKGALLLAAHLQIARATSSMTAELRRTLTQAEFRARWDHFVGLRGGELSAALGTEADWVGVAYISLCRFLAHVVKAGTYLLLALAISTAVSAAALVLGVATYGFVRGIIRHAQRTGVQQNAYRAAFLSEALDALAGMKALKAMALEGRVLPLLEGSLAQLEAVQRSNILAHGFIESVQEPIRAAAVAVLLWLMLRLWALPAEHLFLLVMIFGRLHGETGSLQSLYARVKTYLPAYQSIEAHIQAARDAEEETGGDPPPRFGEAIRLEGVSFSYGEAPVLREVDLEIPAGSFVSIVGASGAGKSTLLDLLLGLRHPDVGRVVVDGMDLRGADLRSWREQVGYVPQETLLFHTSIRENVTLRADDVGDEDLERALAQARCADFLEAFEDGLETIVGERGQRLSGGQRQRLAFARALVRRPTLLVLDEVTASLDPATEEEIVATLSQLRGELTIVAVSHQEELTRAADLVVRLEGGRLSEAAPRRPGGVTP